MYLLHFDAKTVLLIDLSFSTRKWDDLAVTGERKKVLHWQTHTKIQFQQWIGRIKFSVLSFCVYFNCNFDAFWHVSRIKAYMWDLKFSH